MSRMNFSSRVLGIFDAFSTDYESMTQLMKDLAKGRDIYDAESDRVVSKAEAESTVLDFSRQVLGITTEMLERKDRRSIERAWRDNKREWFDIIEDVVDETLTTGLIENEWFNTLAEVITIEYGDRQDFIADVPSVLAVATVGTSHHDHIMQRLAPGKRYTVPTERHAVKVGADINKYILGQVAWDKFIAAIDKAYMLDIQSKTLAAVDTAVSLLPSGASLTGNGVLDATSKAAFLTIADNVAAANGTSDVIVMGTRTALRSVPAIVDVNWIANIQKDNLANLGNIGVAEGLTLVEMPNRFTDGTLTSKVFSDKNIYFFASNESNRFIKIVQEGGAYIDEVMERGISNGYMADLQSFEVQRIYGAGVVPGAIFGRWVLP